MDYPSNSDLSKREAAQKEERVINKVDLSGGVGTKKKSAGRKLADIFIQDDIESVKEYVVTDVIIPGIKDTIMNIMSMFFYGETRGKSSSLRSSSPTSRVSYRSYFDERPPKREASTRSRSNTGFDYDDLVFDKRSDAELVLDEMEASLERYKTLSVFEMYDIAGEVAPFTYQRYGWTSLRNARVVQIHGGQYIIDMPKALPIE